MPILPPAPQPNVKRLFLPSTENNAPEDRAYVDMNVQPLVGADITRSNISSPDPYGEWLASRIVDWNLVEADGTPCLITYENVLRLGAANIRFLNGQKLEEVKPLDDESKKNSTSTLTP